jgi:hypothetical protein
VGWSWTTLLETTTAQWEGTGACVRACVRACGCECRTSPRWSYLTAVQTSQLLHSIHVHGSTTPVLIETTC